MFIKRRYILFFLIAAFCAKCNAAISQIHITPTLISSTSGYDTVPFLGWTLSYSVGEPAITTLGPVNNLILTQGFEQPTVKTCTITVVTSANPNSICLGESASLNALVTTTGNGGPIKYLWSPSASINNNAISNPIATPTSVTTYSVIVYAPGCISDTGNVTVAVNPTPTITVSGNKNSCLGDNTVLTASGAATYNWWNTGETTPAITVSPSVTGNIIYTVSGADANNCKDTTSFIMIVHPRPIPVITGNTTICSGGNSTLTASGGNMYLWSTGETSSTIKVSPTSTTTYSVIASNGFCSSGTSAIVTINSVSVTVSGNTTVCTGNSTILTASGGVSYSWSTGATTSSITVKPTITTTYTVTIRDTNGCLATGTITVAVSEGPGVSAFSNYTTICSGNYAMLTATSTGAVNYFWSPGTHPNNDTVFVSPQNSNTYSVIATDLNGCTSTDTVHIKVIPNPHAQLVIKPNSYLYCTGDSIAPVTATGTISGTIVWLPNGGEAPLHFGNTYTPPSITASYWVVQGSMGCFSSPATFSVTLHPSPAVTASSDLTICAGFTARLSATVSGDTSGVKYEWYNDTDSLIHVSANSNFSVNPASTTFYTVKVINANSCYSLKDTLFIFVKLQSDCGIHIYNGITPNGDGNNDVWWIDGIESFKNNTVHIFNRWGTNVWEGKNYDNDKVIWKGANQQGQALPDGTYYYLVKLFDNDGHVLFSDTKWVEITR